MKILITGGNGYIAKSLFIGLKDKHEITTITRQDFDLTDYDATCKWFYERYFDVIIHTAIVGVNKFKQEQNIIQQNFLMHDNLLKNKHHFNKFITFGSGAEIFQSNTEYGISKKLISESIKNVNNWYNLRIFGVFDNNELNTRFIKANILRYINKESMQIHTDKIMDFFYMKDLISLVDYYITNDGTKEINCCYEYKYTLSNIANIINQSSTYTVPIAIENKGKLDFYCGEYSQLPIKTIGMVTGIKNTFEILRDSINLI
jgi:nucleoside-diphosphate-sugar epimerase